MKRLELLPKELDILKEAPKQLFYEGDISLLEKPRVSIVGTRRPSQYTKTVTTKLAKAFKDIGYVVVSGAAMGVDALSHQAACPSTVAVMANSLDIVYPKVNESLIKKMREKALIISEYEPTTRATKYSFVHRNRIVVALGEALIITEADLNSGSIRSAQIAIEMGKEIFVLSHRVGESLGTQKLLLEGYAKPIIDIDAFISSFGELSTSEKELEFFKNAPMLDDALREFGDKIYEWELEGKITIKDLRVYLA